MGNINDFLSAAAQECAGFRDARRFLVCSNKQLGDRFYYGVSDLTSDAWSHHYSDCDLNVYLLYDAARQNGIELSIVYFPSHALIAFRERPSGPWIYWETTLNGNHGGIAEKNDPRYIKTPDKFFDSPMSMAMAEDIYPLLIIPDLHNDKDVINEFNKINGWVVETPYYRDSALIIKNISSPYDIETLNVLMKERPTSVVIRLLSADWYNSHNMRKTAADLLSAIPPEKCRIHCIKTLAKARGYYTPDMLTASVLDCAGIDATREDVRSVYGLSLVILILSTVGIAFSGQKKTELTGNNKH